MPITEDMMDHPILGPPLRQGIELGRKQSRERIQRMLMRQIEARFGALNNATRERIEQMSDADIEDTGIRFATARTLEDLFKR